MVSTQSSFTDAAASVVLSHRPDSLKQCSLTLEILHGRTRFPHRPVHGARFLIGADPVCDLRLGGVDTPPLHSLLTLKGDEICLEAISTEPQLLVNDEPVAVTLLNDGDRIAIGSFELLAHVNRGGAIVAVDIPRAPNLAAATDELDPAELTALELLELIERESAQVEQFEQKRRMGADALMHAVVSRTKDRTTDDHPADPIVQHKPQPPRFIAHSIRPGALPALQPLAVLQGDAQGVDDLFVRHLEQLGQALNELASDLDCRLRTAAGNEAEFGPITALLQEARQTLGPRIEWYLAQIESRTERRAHPPAMLERAIA